MSTALPVIIAGTYLPIIHPQMESHKVDIGGAVVCHKILPLQEGPGSGTLGVGITLQQCRQPASKYT